MSIEGNVLSNTFANNAAENAYQDSVTTRDDITFDMGRMDAPKVEALPQETSAVRPITSVIATKEVTPGDEILNSLQKISDTHQQKTADLIESVENIRKDGMNMSDLMNMQMKLMEHQITSELISKATNSVSQGVQTLLRNQ